MDTGTRDAEVRSYEQQAALVKEEREVPPGGPGDKNPRDE